MDKYYKKYMESACWTLQTLMEDHRLEKGKDFVPTDVKIQNY